MPDLFTTLFWCKKIYKKFVIIILFLITLWLYGINYLMNVPDGKILKSNTVIYDFDYAINNHICDDDVFLLIIVHSAANHFEHRNLIRETWGNPGGGLPNIKIAFLLALANEFQKEIDLENQLHHDIIQGNFVDAYRNLTYKHVMGLHWSATNCKNTKYLLKMDDDIFIDIYQFVNFINSQMKYVNLKNSIACYFQNGMPVIRDPISKWFVSKEEFSKDTFNDYCSGWAYLTTTHVAQRLYQAAKTLPYFWVDDVHVTGSAAQLANVSRIRTNHLYALETDGLMDWTRSSKHVKWDKIFAPTWGDLVLSRNAHRKAFKCHIMNCNCCYKPSTTQKPSTTSTTVKGMAQLIQFHRISR